MDDTDTLIALVSSLLDHPIEHEIILEMLVITQGDVKRAAQTLNNTDDFGGGVVERGKKRKKPNLDAWLKNAKNSRTECIDLTQEQHASSSSTIIKPKSGVQVASNSLTKPPTDLMTVLRQPRTQEQSKTRKIHGLPPLMLSNPSMVAEHTPCTLHLSVLPPDLACRLFYVMKEASKQWQRNKWWLFDRVVESPHRTSFFARPTKAVERNVNEWQEAARFWYNGRLTDPPKDFLPEMEQACEIIERVVNEELKKRKRYPLEYAGTQGKDLQSNEPIWEANVAAANCYEGAKESVGFHSDQLTYLGPYPTIASLSLGTTRIFRLREVIPTNEADSRQARTFNIPLTHNSLTIMHASCQERFKHSIPPQSTIDLFRPTLNTDIGTSSEASPGSCVSGSAAAAAYAPSNCRINITFRFYRPDFRPPSIPRCDCGVPTILRADMKNRINGETDKYWWTCYAGAQNDGKGCKFWRVMDMESEGRGPCVGDLHSFKSLGEK